MPRRPLLWFPLTLQKCCKPCPDLLVGCLGEELRSDRKKVSCAVHELREYYLSVGLMENIM